MMFGAKRDFGIDTKTMATNGTISAAISLSSLFVAAGIIIVIYVHIYPSDVLLF